MTDFNDLNYEKIITQMVGDDPRNIRHHPNPPYELQVIALDYSRGAAFKHIKNPHPKIVDAAIEYRPDNIQFVNDPSEVLQTKAVMGDPKAILHIASPSTYIKTLAITETPSTIAMVMDAPWELFIKILSEEHPLTTGISSLGIYVKNNYKNFTREQLKEMFEINPAAIRYFDHEQIADLDHNMILEIVASKGILLAHLAEVNYFGYGDKYRRGMIHIRVTDWRTDEQKVSDAEIMWAAILEDFTVFEHIPLNWITDEMRNYFTENYDEHRLNVAPARQLINHMNLEYKQKLYLSMKFGSKFYLDVNSEDD